MSADRHAAMRLGLAVAAAILVLDQISKWWIVFVVMQPPRIIEVTPFLNLVMAWNPGVSFGVLASDSPYLPWLLSALALVVVAVLVLWLRKAESRLLATGLGLVIGGAIGNVVDRLRFGAVADFIDVHFAGWHWPAFNVADAAITVGVILVLCDALLERRESHR